MENSINPDTIGRIISFANSFMFFTQFFSAIPGSEQVVPIPRVSKTGGA